MHRTLLSLAALALALCLACPTLGAPRLSLSATPTLQAAGTPTLAPTPQPKKAKKQKRPKKKQKKNKKKAGKKVPKAKKKRSKKAKRVSGSFLALSYNVAGLPEGLSGSNPSVNMPLIGPLLNGYDLVLLQESWQTPVPNVLAPLRVYHEILDAAALHPYRSVSAPLPLGGDPSRPSALVSDGLNRFSQFPFDPVTRQAWSECFVTSADCLALKGFSVARTAVAPGIEIDVYNLHMEAGGDVEDDRLRAQGVDELAAFMQLFSADRAVIVGGDFNLHSDTEPDASAFQSLLDQTGLVDVCAALACPEPGRIDKFLYRSSDELVILPSSWNFETEVFVRGDGEPLSDHDALAVGFRWFGWSAP